VRTRVIFSADGADGASLRRDVVSLFCRHNRFTSDCSICSRGTVLEEAPDGGGTRGGRHAGEARPGSTPRAPARGGGAKRPPHGAATYRGRYGAVGPYERAGEIVEVRLERVPGGLRLAEWAAERLTPRAPVLAVDDLVQVVERAAEARAFEEGEPEALRVALGPRGAPADHASGADGAEAGIQLRRDSTASGHEPREPQYGASPGRSGELRDELRVEPLDGGRVRVARWVLRPGTGWEVLDAPTMLPAHRYFEALGDAAARGVLG
jgi:hypothetical protein